MPEARRYAARNLPECGEALKNAIVLMVSELVTNSVLYGGDDFTMSIQSAEGVLRIAVTDPGLGIPVVHVPATNEPAGRGLRIVASLADNWGVRYPERGPGKTVWFTVRTPVPSD